LCLLHHTVCVDHFRWSGMCRQSDLKLSTDSSSTSSTQLERFISERSCIFFP
jgi:hypothetical protein